MQLFIMHFFRAKILVDLLLLLLLLLLQLTLSLAPVALRSVRRRVEPTGNDSQAQAPAVV